MKLKPLTCKSIDDQQVFGETKQVNKQSNNLFRKLRRDQPHWSQMLFLPRSGHLPLHIVAHFCLIQNISVVPCLFPTDVQVSHPDTFRYLTHTGTGISLIHPTGAHA